MLKNKTIKELFLFGIEKYSSKNLNVNKYIYRNGNQDKLTYQEYELSVKRVANYLKKELKVKKGDRIGILSDNRPEWGISYFAINYVGAEIVPIDSKYNPNEIDFIFENSGLTYLFLSLAQFDKIEELISCKKKIKNFIIFDEVRDLEKCQTSFNKIVLDDTVTDFSIIDAIEVKEDDIASIIYTSGTTGGAKGVLLSNKNIVSNVLMVKKVSPFKVGDKVLSILPLHHTFETTVGLLVMFYQGIWVVYLEFVSPTHIIKTIKSERINGMVVVPLFIKKIYDKIAKEIKKSIVSTSTVKILQFTGKIMSKFGIENANAKTMNIIKKRAGLDSLDVFFSGAAALQKEVSLGMEKLGFNVMQGYGLTEASPVVSVNLPTDNRHGSIGKVLPGVTVRIDNIGVDGVGEIVVSGDNVMKGYYNEKEATDKILRNGELYTGDLGYIDKDGFIFISGRSKNILVTNGGKNIYPESIEDIINDNEFILESVILGMKNKNDDGEVPYAFIVPNIEIIEKVIGKSYTNYSSIKVLIEKVVKEVNSKLVDYKKIKGYKISMEELPKTSTKKIKRYLLKNDIDMI